MILSAESAGLVASLWEFVQDYPDPVLFGLLVLCGVGLPIPEEPILLMAGAIVVKLSSGEEPEIQLLRVSAVCAFGILVGDLACFHAGRTIGQRIFGWGLFRIWPFRSIATRPRRVRAERFFQRYGPWAIFIARFFAGVRLVMYFSAGMSRRVSYLRFLLMDFLGVLVSVPLSIWIGFLAWRELQDWDAAKAKLGTFHAFLVGGIAAGLVVWFILARKNRAAEKEARRRALGIPPAPPG